MYVDILFFISEAAVLIVLLSSLLKVGTAGFMLSGTTESVSFAPAGFAYINLSKL